MRWLTSAASGWYFPALTSDWICSILAGASPAAAWESAERFTSSEPARAGGAAGVPGCAGEAGPTGVLLPPGSIRINHLKFLSSFSRQILVNRMASGKSSRLCNLGNIILLGRRLPWLPLCSPRQSLHHHARQAQPAPIRQCLRKLLFGHFRGRFRRFVLVS